MTFNSDTILALDPSSSIVGYCVATFSERLLNAGLIKPPSKIQNAMLRMDSLITDVCDLVLEYKPCVVLVEVPGGKVHGRIKGKGHGLTTYAFACGRIYEAVSRLLIGGHVIPISEADWTGGIPKEQRAATVAMKWRNINASADKGLDAFDAAGMLLWWLQTRKVAALSGVGR